MRDVMSSFWTEFATSHDPAGAGGPKWPRYDATADAQFIVLKEPGLRVDTMAASGTEAACAFWDDVRVSCRTKVECQAQVGGVLVGG